jgi:hypothetical protein
LLRYKRKQNREGFKQPQTKKKRKGTTDGGVFFFQPAAAKIRKLQRGKDTHFWGQGEKSYFSKIINRKYIEKI